jgi:hypothetical protein
LRRSGLRRSGRLVGGLGCSNHSGYYTILLCVAFK